MKENKTLGIVTVALAIVIMVFAFQIPHNAPNDFGQTVSVTGNAEITAIADEVIVTLGINTKGETAKEAEDANSELSQAVFDALAKYKTETKGYYLNQDYEWDLDTRINTPIGYQARHTITVTATANDASDIIELVTTAGDVEIQYVSYEISDEREAKLKEEALAKAVTQSKEKAEILVESAGANLGAVYSIQESNYYVRPVFAESMALAGVDSKSMETPDVDVSVQVQVSYLIR